VVIDKKCIVIKIGSSTITSEGKALNKKLLTSLANQVSQLFSDGWKVIIVSSGAVALGSPRMKNCDINSILCKQRAAARGQPLLMAGWSDALLSYTIDVDQLLFTKTNFSFQMNVIKAIDDGIVIANGDDTGNDPITEEKIIYEDNDDLAADIAIALNATIVLYLTDVPGILDQNGNCLQSVSPFEDLQQKGVVYGEKSGKGTGGAKSKHLNASRIAKNGIRVVIARGIEDEVILKAVRKEHIGTTYTV
jgi:glutamate 5-kinase